MELEMSEKKDYLLNVFESVKQHPKLIEAALIFYHAEMPVDQAQKCLTILEKKLHESTLAH
jgi:hypothetical protein